MLLWRGSSPLNGACRDQTRCSALALPFITSSRPLSSPPLTCSCWLSRALTPPPLRAPSCLACSLAQACTTSFMYWHRAFVPLYLKELYENPLDAHRLPYMIAAMRDCIAPLRLACHQARV